MKNAIMDKGGLNLTNEEIRRGFEKWMKRVNLFGPTAFDVASWNGAEYGNISTSLAFVAWKDSLMALIPFLRQGGEAMKRENILANAIRDAALNLRIINEAAEPNGPELLMLCDDIVKNGAVGEKAIQTMEWLINAEESDKKDTDFVSDARCLIRNYSKSRGTGPTKKTCILHHGRFVWELIVDDKHITFTDRDSREYFKDHYKALGYEVILSGDGSRDYSEMLPAASCEEKAAC